MLTKLISATEKSVRTRMASCPLEALLAKIQNMPPPPDLSAALTKGKQQRGLAVIAEFKPASPSTGVINDKADPLEIVESYRAAGATALSVIVEERYFLGSPSLFARIAFATPLPTLYKGFVVGSYQVYEARALGASAVLLIVRILDNETFHQLASLARSLGLLPLPEVHSEVELERALTIDPIIVAINSRDLDTLRIDPTIHQRIAHEIPQGILSVAESGLKDGRALAEVRDLGYTAALVGTALMVSRDPGLALSRMLYEMEVASCDKGLRFHRCG